jgi:type IV pilus assembly protein PilA
MISSGKCATTPSKKKHAQGFTLVELMVVVAIVSILAVIAIPAYQDYVVRSKVSEGMVFMAEAKTSVSEYFYMNKKLPSGNNQAGLPVSTDYDTHQYVSELEVSTVSPPDGIITVTFKIAGSSATGKKLQLVPETIDGLVTWTCSAPTDDGLKLNHAPPNCRG